MDVRHSLYKKYARKHADVAAHIARLEAELDAARQRGKLIATVLEDMEALLSGELVPITANESRVAVEAEAASTDDAAEASTSAQAQAPVAPQKKEVKAKKSAAKESNVHDLSIVDAAIALAKQHNAKEAKAGDVYDWFEEAGYHGRNGVPNRNSIYVSLNREAAQSKGRAGQRLRKERRGVFRFL